MAKHPPAETYDELMARLIREMPDVEWLPPGEAAKGLEKLYRRTDPRKLTEKIRDHALAILIEYPKEKTALKLLSVCNAALDSGDYYEGRIEGIREAYRDTDPKAWQNAKGGHNRAKLYEADKAEFKRIGTEILTKRGNQKTSRRLLTGLIARKRYPAITDEELKKLKNKCSKANSGWLPGDD